MGHAIVARLIADGAQVLASDIHDQAGQTAADQMGARYVRLDVTQEANWAAAMTVAAEMGGLYGLVNNAVFYDPKDLEHTSADSFNTAMAVNELGPFLGMKYASRAMQAGAGGSIVNISSSSGLKGSPRAFAYCATKWALRGMTKAAAMDLAQFNIRVNSIHPGQTETDNLFVAYSNEELAKRTARIPLGRNGKPREIADLVQYLLSPISGFVTGAEIAIDGGFTL